MGRVETANNWALLEQSILVVTNLGWRRGTAEREGCSISAGRLLGAEGGKRKKKKQRQKNRDGTCTSGKEL